MTTTTTTTSTASGTVDNGVDVAALLGAREALTAEPAAARFTWRARGEWVDGTHVRTRADGFFGLGEEQARPAPHVVESDHPAQFAASDCGMTPTEMVLSGLCGCLVAGMATVAQNRGIQLRSVVADVEGEMDMAGILGIDAETRNGFEGVRVTFTVDADATPDQVRGLVAQSQKRSAVYDVFSNPTAVTVAVAS